MSHKDTNNKGGEDAELCNYLVNKITFGLLFNFKIVMIFLDSLINLFWIPLSVALIAGIVTLIISKIRLSKSVIMSINYADSFWTYFENEYYIVLNVTIVNNTDSPLNNLTFRSEPDHEVLDNIWSNPTGHRDGSATMIMGAMRQINQTLGNDPITILARGSKTGNLIFDSDGLGCDIISLIASHDRNTMSITVRSQQITHRDID